ncbi:hypothetical protein ACWEQL_03775 [Kitasatospora sp. NPDC004240]
MEAPDGWTLASFWITALGTALAALGSAMRAWFTMLEYRDLLARAQLPTFARQLMWALRPGLLNLIRIPALVATTVAVVRSWQQIKQEGGEDARRLGELINQFVAWGLVLWGALLAFVAALIKLIAGYAS